MTDFPLPFPALGELSPSLQKIVRQILDDASPSPAPFLLHMLGIPGAGKSSFLSALADLWATPSPTLLGFDQIMEQMPEYKGTSDKKEAFVQCELPARSAGYLVLHDLLHKKANVFFDNGGSAASHLDLLRFARDVLGYRLAIVSVVSCPLAARERILRRYETEGRYTPHEYLEDRADKIRALQESYQQLTPHFYEIGNMESSPFVKAKFLETVAQTACAVHQDLTSWEFCSKVGL